MINLLPPEVKAQNYAARSNRLLLRYNILLIAALGFLLAAIGLVYVYLGNAKSAADTTIASNVLKAADYTAVEAEAQTFTQNLANAKQIINNDVAYTKVILKIAGVLPPGVVLNTLNLDSQTFGTPTTLTANVKDYSTILTLKSSLQASALFSDVSIQTISDEGTGDYPLTATFSVTIRKDAAI